MTKKHAILVALATFHLVIVVLGSLQIDFRTSTNSPGWALAWYGSVTGANNYYGFFSPGLDVPTQATFSMLDKDENTIAQDTLAVGSTTESNLRLKSINFLGVLDEHD